MRLPIIRGVIARRILVNYRVDPDILAALLPSPFRPKLVGGAGLAGICLIRLERVRPTFLPAWLGISSENAAHRIAVEWHQQGSPMEGVYVRRRDTSSRWNALAGGRLFPGIHQRARFTVRETAERCEVSLRSDDGTTHLAVRARPTAQLPASSVFRSLEEASAFFQAGSLGYSATSDAARFQGLELRCLHWRMEPLAIEEVRSSYFDDPFLFPSDSLEFDSAFLMRGIEHEWHGRDDLCCPAKGAMAPVAQSALV